MLKEITETERIRAAENAILTIMQGGTANMHDFIKLQYKMGQITIAQVEKFSAAGWITSEQAAEITGAEQ